MLVLANGGVVDSGVASYSLGRRIICKCRISYFGRWGNLISTGLARIKEYFWTDIFYMS